MVDLLRTATGAILMANARPAAVPLCAKHEPKASLQKEGNVYVVFIHCDECRFTAWLHPDTYYDMMVENMLDEVSENIIKGG